MANRQLTNIIANFAGVGAGFIFPLCFQVAYYRILGSESYGLVGLYASLALLASSLDMGLAQTTVREFALRAAASDRSGEMKSILFTLLIIYCGIGLVFGSLTAASSNWAATQWLHPAKLSTGEVAASVALMGAMLAFSFPSIAFNAALSGIQRQVLGNSFSIISSVCRGGVVLTALAVFGPKLMTFFTAQLLFSSIEVIILGILTWAVLPVPNMPVRFSVLFVKGVWRFSSSNGLAVLIGQIMMVGDRFILSAMLPLNVFGLYSFAVTVASVVTKLSGPFSNAFFPHFVELIEQRKLDGLSHAYHFITQLASATLISVGVCIALYSGDLIFLLTDDAASSASMGPVVTMLAVANTLNALMWLPRTLQVAAGVTWISLRITIAQIIFYIPALWLLVPRFGVYAPAALWLTVNLVNFPIFILLTHRVALRGEAKNWVKHAIVSPACVAGAIFAIGLAIAPTQISWLTTIPWLSANVIAAIAVVVFCMPKTNKFVRQTILAIWLAKSRTCRHLPK